MDVIQIKDELRVLKYKIKLIENQEDLKAARNYRALLQKKLKENNEKEDE